MCGKGRCRGEREVSVAWEEVNIRYSGAVFSVPFVRDRNETAADHHPLLLGPTNHQEASGILTQVRERHTRGRGKNSELERRKKQREKDRVIKGE